MKYFGIVEKMLRPCFNFNERLEIFLTCFCNILCYVGWVARFAPVSPIFNFT